MVLPSLFLDVTQPMLVVLYRSCGVVCRLQRTWCWKLYSKMERNLCFMLDSRHVKKVISPYQLAVAVGICFMKSWPCNTCGCQTIQIFALVQNHKQTDLHFNISCIFSSSTPFFKASCLPHSFLHLPNHVFFLPSFLLSFIASLFPKFLHPFINSSLPMFCLIPFFIPFSFFYYSILSSFFPCFYVSLITSIFPSLLIPFLLFFLFSFS